MLIRKAKAGNIPGHSWEEDGQVLDLEDYLAHELLRIPGGGFTVADAIEEEPEPPAELLHRPLPEPEPELDPHTSTPAPPKKSPGRPKLPRDAFGNIIR